MVVLIISLAVVLVFRLMIFFFVAEAGINVQVDGAIHSFSKGTLTLGLWAFLGFLQLQSAYSYYGSDEGAGADDRLFRFTCKWISP